MYSAAPPATAGDSGGPLVSSSIMSSSGVKRDMSSSGVRRDCMGSIHLPMPPSISSSTGKPSETVPSSSLASSIGGISPSSPPLSPQPPFSHGSGSVWSPASEVTRTHDDGSTGSPIAPRPSAISRLASRQLTFTRSNVAPFFGATRLTKWSTRHAFSVV